MLRLIATHREAETLINIGAYAKGSNPDIDEAIAMMPAINNFLRQDIDEGADMASSVDRLAQLCAASMAYARSRAAEKSDVAVGSGS